MKPEPACPHVWQHLHNHRLETLRGGTVPAVTYGIYRCAKCLKLKTDQLK